MISQLVLEKKFTENIYDKCDLHIPSESVAKPSILLLILL